MKLINNWKQALGHFSTLALGAAAAVPTFWATHPELHILVPADKMAVATAAISIIGLAGKFIQQGGPVVQLPKDPESSEAADVIKTAIKQQGTKLVVDALKKAMK